MSAFRRHPTSCKFTDAVSYSSKEQFPWSPTVLVTTAHLSKANTVMLSCLLAKKTLWTPREKNSGMNTVWCITWAQLPCDGWGKPGSCQQLANLKDNTHASSSVPTFTFCNICVCPVLRRTEHLEVYGAMEPQCELIYIFSWTSYLRNLIHDCPQTKSLG